MEINVIPDRFTFPLGIVHSLGNEIAWTTDRSLFSYAPGDAEPTLVYMAPSDSYIPDFVGSPAGYAILSQVTPEGHITFQWQLLYLSAPGAVPVLLDKFDNDAMPLPTLAMDENHIAWTRTRGTGNEVVSELDVVDIAALASRETLVTKPFHDTNVEHPVLHNDELWYGVRNNDWDAGTEYPHLEQLDLAHLDAAPRVYGEEQRAFMPAVNDQFVVWKGGGEPQDSADSYGSLYVYARSDGAITEVSDIGTRTDRVLNPTVGHRYVAWRDGYAQLNLYDLEEHRTNEVIGYDPEGPPVPASVADNLLAFTYSPAEGKHLQLRWALLPD